MILIIIVLLPLQLMSIEKDTKQKRSKNPYNQVTGNLLFTTRWILNKHAKILKPFNLTEQQYNVLKILRERHPEAASVKFILNGMVDQMSNASRLVDKLATKGLIQRAKSLDDFRSVDIFLNEKGFALMDELALVMNDYENSSCGLTESEVELFNSLLLKLRNFNY